MKTGNNRCLKAYLMLSRLYPVSVEFRQDCRFGVRSYCVRKEQQGPLRLRPASATVSLRKFSHASKIWVSRSGRWLHSCLILPFGRSGSLARKTASPAGKAQKSFTKGKKLTTQTFQANASKKNDNRRRERDRHKPLPEFPQDRECTGHEKAVLRTALSFGALWRLYL